MYEKARHDKTRQDKTRQDKTRQDKTTRCSSHTQRNTHTHTHTHRHAHTHIHHTHTQTRTLIHTHIDTHTHTHPRRNIPFADLATSTHYSLTTHYRLTTAMLRVTPSSWGPLYALKDARTITHTHTAMTDAQYRVMPKVKRQKYL